MEWVLSSEEEKIPPLPSYFFRLPVMCFILSLFPLSLLVSIYIFPLLYIIISLMEPNGRLLLLFHLQVVTVMFINHGSRVRWSWRWGKFSLFWLFTCLYIYTLHSGDKTTQDKHTINDTFFSSCPRHASCQMDFIPISEFQIPNTEEMYI